MSTRLLTALLLTMALALSACSSTDTADDATDTADAADSADGAASGGDGEPLVIGYAAALTGEGAVGDVPALEGVEHAVEQVNAEGGVDGHLIELVVRDMESDPATGSRVAQQLVDEGADVILGPPFPAMGVGVIQTAAEVGVPVLSVTSTQPEYPVVGGTPAYLVAFGDNVQSAAVAEYALSEGIATALTVTSPDFSYTEENPAFFAEVFEAGGGEVVGSETFSIGQADFSAQVTSIAGMPEEPDAIFTAMFMPDLGIFVNQLRAAGVGSRILGVDGFDTQGLIDFAGESAEGIAFATHGFPQEGSPFAAFVAAVEEATGSAPEAPALTALGGDAVMVVAAAVEAAGSTDPAAIGDALAELQAVEVVTGEISYAGTNGVPAKTVTIAQVVDGSFAFVDAFVPETIPER